METADVEQLFQEIGQLREQYQAEVGSRRKTWPKSVVERVFQLSRLGVRYGVIAERSRVPLNTIYSWENRPPRKGSGSFIALPVAPASPTARIPLQRKTVTRIPTVTVVMRDGTRVEGLPAKAIVKFLRALQS